jgi:hypothetical protein
VIVSISGNKDDRLLWRLRRSLVAAKAIGLGNIEDHRRALILTAEIRGHIKLLTERLGLIEDEMKSAVRRAGAINAYHKAAGFARRPAQMRGKEVN